MLVLKAVLCCSYRAHSRDSFVRWGSTKVGTLLKAKPKQPEWLWCEKDLMVIDAIKKMTDANVGSLMVVDCEGEDVCRHKEEAVVGILTERWVFECVFECVPRSLAGCGPIDRWTD